jgi:hypothetical protein
MTATGYFCSLNGTSQMLGYIALVPQGNEDAIVGLMDFNAVWT